MSIKNLQPICEGMRSDRKPARALALLTLMAWMCALPSVSSAQPASGQTKQAFLTQLQTWLATNPTAQGAVSSVKDNRFTVPQCTDAFTFAFSDQSQRTLVTECVPANWKRRIRLRKSPEANKPAGDYQFTYELKQSIAAEQPITHTTLKRVKKLRRNVAQNALKTLPKKTLFAARNLRKGQILVLPDVYSARYVAVADTTIPMGHPISADLLRLQKVTRKVPNDAITDLSGLEHLAANRLIHPNVILRKRDLKKAKLVQRGEQLILSSASTSYSIETTAVALQDGYYGDQIKLRNTDSNQELRAVVSGINRAKALH